MSDAKFSDSKLIDIAFMGIRATIGVIFILHAMGKFNPGFAARLPEMGLPAELQIPIALGELLPGILLIIGVLSRISASVLSVIMVGAIFHIKGAESITGQGGIEFDLILLAVSLLIIVAGPGKVSLSHIVKKIPRFLH